MRKRPLIGLLLGALSVLAACTESHDVESSDEAGNGGARSGAGGSGGSGGTGNVGNETCDTGCSGVPMFSIPGCCSENDKCGLDISDLGFGEGCAELNAPGTPNASCPSQLFLGFYPLAGCCKPDGTCGLQADLVGLGCTSAGSAAEMSCEH